MSRWLTLSLLLTVACGASAEDHDLSVEPAAPVAVLDPVSAEHVASSTEALLPTNASGCTDGVGNYTADRIAEHCLATAYIAPVETEAVRYWFDTCSDSDYDRGTAEGRVRNPYTNIVSSVRFHCLYERPWESASRIKFCWVDESADCTVDRTFYTVWSPDGKELSTWLDDNADGYVDRVNCPPELSLDQCSGVDSTKNGTLLPMPDEHEIGPSPSTW